MDWLPILLALVGALILVVGILVLIARTPGRSVRAWLRVTSGRGFGVDELARRVDLPVAELTGFEPRYSEVKIPKRSGGTRVLQVPAKATKDLQRRLLRRLLARLRTHDAATGFEPGKSIVHNALPHVGRAVIVHMDVVDFFPSTSSDRIDRIFRWAGWDAEAAALLVRLTTHEGGLPQGAPTSPRISNLVNRSLDAELTRLAAWRKGRYTRYADDITFSFPRDYPRKMRGIVQATGRALRKRGYRMHRTRKLGIWRRHQRQRVTGLVVNEKVQLPRETRRWLRAVRHRLETTGSCSLTRQELAGWAALERMIELQRG